MLPFLCDMKLKYHFLPGLAYLGLLAFLSLPHFHCSGGGDDGGGPAPGPSEPQSLQVTRGANMGPMASLQVSWTKGENALETRLAFALASGRGEGGAPANCNTVVVETTEESYTHFVLIPAALEDLHYSFRACSVGEGGQVTPGVTQTFTIGGPREPQNLQVTRGANEGSMASLQISWTKGENALETRLAFVMAFDTEPTPPADCETTIAETTEESYTHVLPLPTTPGDHHYSFRACSVGEGGQVTPGVTQTFTIEEPDEPTGLRVARGANVGTMVSFDVSWMKDENARETRLAYAMAFATEPTPPADCNTMITQTQEASYTHRIPRPTRPGNHNYVFRACSVGADGQVTTGVVSETFVITVGTSQARDVGDLLLKSPSTGMLQLTWTKPTTGPGDPPYTGARIVFQEGSAPADCHTPTATVPNTDPSSYTHPDSVMEPLIHPLGVSTDPIAYHFRVCSLDANGVPNAGLTRKALLGGHDEVGIPDPITAQAYGPGSMTQINITYNIHVWMPGNLSIRGLRLVLRKGTTDPLTCWDYAHKRDIDVTGLVAIDADPYMAPSTSYTATFTETGTGLSFGGGAFRVRACVTWDGFSRFSTGPLNTVAASGG